MIAITKRRGLGLGLALVGLVFGPAFAFSRAEDDEERAFERAATRRVMQENCLICHSREMIETQRLTPAQWKAEVEKMIGWGAPVAKDQETPLIDFLSREYSDTLPPAPPARMTYRQALGTIQPDAAIVATGHAQAGEVLYAKNCANCHGSAAKGADSGTNLVEKPVLLRLADYNEVVRQGRGRMPGFQKVLSPAQEADLLAWLRLRRD